MFRGVKEQMYFCVAKQFTHSPFMCSRPQAHFADRQQQVVHEFSGRSTFMCVCVCLCFFVSCKALSTEENARWEQCARHVHPHIYYEHFVYKVTKGFCFRIYICINGFSQKLIGFVKFICEVLYFC